MNFNDPGLQRALDAIRKSEIANGRGIVVAIDDNARSIRAAPPSDGRHEFVVVHLKRLQHASSAFARAGGWREAGLAVINCSAALVAAIFTFGSAASTPFTAGTSTLLTVAGYSATAATGSACLNSVFRTYNASDGPERNAQLDSWPAYRTTMRIIDGISLIGVGATVITSIKVLSVLRRAGVTLKAGRNASTHGLKSRARKRLASENTKSTQRPLSNKKHKHMVRSGQAPKRMKAAEVSQGLIKKLMDQVAAGLSFAGSTFDGNIYQFSLYIAEIEE